MRRSRFSTRRRSQHIIAYATRTLRWLVVPAAIGATLAIGVPSSRTATASSTFLVDSAGDAGDATPGDGICDTGGGVCTLRAAIQESNALAGADTIDFGINTGSVTIAPLSPLPIITDKVKIDASTQPGWAFVPIVEIRGDSAGAGADGLELAANNSVIRGLVINRFSGRGVHLLSDGNQVSRCYIGVSLNGASDEGNTLGGVFINNSSSNTIGGTTPSDADSNVISGNDAEGVYVSGGTGNVIVDNAIGTNPSTSAAIPNSLTGVYVGNPATGTLIQTNVISGNGNGGIYVDAMTSGTTIVNNAVGTDRFGASAVGNAAFGISIYSSGNVIGTSGAVGAFNVISGNAGVGLGISSSGATGNVVRGNRVGTNLSGTSAIANSGDGITITGASGNTIGGSAVDQGNVISGNAGWGVNLSDAGADLNTIAGNKIGTNSQGTGSLPNFGGIRVMSSDDTIGGSTNSAGNVIAGNTSENLRIGSLFNAVTSIDVFHNFIGTDAFGSAGLGGKGVIIERSQANLGSPGGAGNNVIAGNSTNGITILGSGADENVIMGNRIGISAYGNPLGNQGHGVLISSGLGDDLGDVFNTGNNIIAFNTLDGVRVDGASTNGELIIGNSIYANGGKGIETINSGNAELAPPTITSVGASIDGTACPSCDVSLYSDTAAQGRVYEGSTTATPGGTWSLTTSIAGPHLTATATDSIVGTSEFSPPFAVNLNREAGTSGSPGFGGDGGLATGAQLNGPHGLYFTPSTLYIADTGNNRIRTVSPNNPLGTINTIAGCCASPGFGGDGGPATSAQLSSPTDVFVDGGGNIFIADTNNCRIRKVTGGTISTVAGNGTCGYSGDNGPATSAMINHPHGVGVTAGGDILIADTDNNRIRLVSGGTITTVAGTGGAAFYGDGGLATAAWLNTPHDVYPSPLGGYVIADTQNHRVRRVDGSGVINTIAGTGVPGYSGDNDLAVLARFSAPEAVAVSPIGDVFIADTGNNRIRDVLFGSGLIATVVGTGATGSSPDAVNPLLATLNAPTGIADDELAVSDTGNHTVRSIAANVDPTTDPLAPTTRSSTFCREGIGKPVGALADWSVIVGVVGIIATRRRWRALFTLLSRRLARPAPTAV